MLSKFHPNRALGLLAMLTIVAIAMSVTFLLFDLRKRELRHGQLETESITRMFVKQTKQNFDAMDLVLLGVQERLHTAYGRQFALDSLPVHLLLTTRANGLPHLNALFLTDEKGRIVNSSREIPPHAASIADRKYFQDLVAQPHDGLVIAGPLRSRIDNQWAICLVRQITDAEGHFRGAIVASLNVAAFEKMYDFVNLGFVRPMAIYMNDGTLVAGLPHRESLLGDRAAELERVSLTELDDKVRTIKQVNQFGSALNFALGRVPGYPLLLSVTDDPEEALAAWRETAVPISIGALLIAIFIAGVAAVLIVEQLNEERLALALREADDRYHYTIDSVMDAIVAVDAEQLILLFNPAAEHMFGYSAQQVLGLKLEKLIPMPQREAHARHVRAFMAADGKAQPEPLRLSVRGLRADGTVFPIETTLSQTRIGGKHQVTAVLRDVTERVRAEADLREMNGQLRQLSAALQNVREEERTRISRELHDELGQQLTGLKLDLSWLKTRLKDGRPPPPEKLTEMRHQLDAAISSVRRISSDLRPLILDDLGFGEAVKWQTSEFTKRSGLAVALDLNAADAVTDDALATALFRVVQESLTNVARHAHASQIHIRLVQEGGSLLLTVRDDGQGMAEVVGRGKGVGLISMRERATAMGGSLRINSSPGEGTEIAVTVPLRLETTGTALA